MKAFLSSIDGISINVMGCRSVQFHLTSLSGYYNLNTVNVVSYKKLYEVKLIIILMNTTPTGPLWRIYVAVTFVQNFEGVG